MRYVFILLIMAAVSENMAQIPLKTAYLHDLWNEGVPQKTSEKQFKQELGAWKNMGCEGRGRINQLAVDPKNNAILYAVTPGGGLWRSSDTGHTWNSNFQDFPSIATNWLCFHPTIPNWVFLATGDWRFGVNGDGLYFSTDGGNTWRKRGHPEYPNPVNLTKLIVHPQRPNEMVVLGSTKVYFSQDTGASFSTLLTADSKDIVSLPAHPNTLIISLRNSNKIMKSQDFGKSWKEVIVDTQYTVGMTLKLAVSPTFPNSVFAYSTHNKLFKSTDGGETFFFYADAGSNASSFNIALSVSPHDSTLLFTGGVAFGRNGADKSFTMLLNLNGNYNGVDYHEYSFDSQGLMYVTNDNGIHKSYDGGMTWRKLNHQFNNQELYAFGNSFVSKSLVAGSQDGGSKWYEADSCFICGPNDGGRPIFLPGSDALVLSSDQTRRLYPIHHRKADYVNVIRDIPGNFPYIFGVHPDSSGVLLSNSAQSLLISRDTGNTWNTLRSTMSTARDIFYHPNFSNRIYLLTPNYLDISDNNAQNFYRLKQISGSTLRNLAVHPEDTLMMACIIRDNQKLKDIVQITFDGGKNWTNTGEELVENVWVDLDFHANGDLYLASLNRVYYLPKGTTAWTSFSQGLSKARITELKVDYRNNRVLISTYGRGMWESPVHVNTQFVRTDVQPEVRVFPNPTKEHLNVRGLSSSFTYQIMDIQGRIVSKGKSESSINFQHIQSGIYIVEIVQGELKRTFRIVKEQD